MPASTRDIAVSIVLSFVATLIVALYTTPCVPNHPAFSTPTADRHTYIGMARDGVAFFRWNQPLTVSVYNYAGQYQRVLMPFMARYLPFGLAWNFYLITFFSIVFSGTLLYLFFRALGFDHDIALIGQMLFVSSISGYLYDFWCVDPLSYLLQIALFIALLKRAKLSFCIIFMLAAANKEMCLFIIPLYYLLQKTRKGFIDISALKDTVYAVSPGVILFVMLKRFLPHPHIGVYIWDMYSYLLIHRMTFFLHFREAYGIWGNLALLAAINIPNAPPFLKKGLVYVLCLYLGVFIVWDTDHVIFPAFPIIFGLALLEFKRCRELGNVFGIILLCVYACQYIFFRNSFPWTIIIPALGIASVRLIHTLSGGNTISSNSP